MKLKTSIYSFVFIILSSCLSAQEVTKIAFVTGTRGYQKEIVLTKDSIHITEQGRSINRSESTILLPGNWQEIAEQLGTLHLQTIPDLTSPTTNRFTDAARASSLTLNTADGKTYSHSFDNENPHASLQPMLNIIIELAGD